MEQNKFSVEDGIRVQQEQLNHWEKILTTTAFKALVKFAERKNTTAKDGFEITRGSDLSVFLSNYARKVKVEKFVECLPTGLQKKWIKQANKYLYFDEDGSDQTVLNAIAKIRDHKDQIQTVDVALSDDDNVFVCEDFEFRFTCKDFLILIGYKFK
jgi:hypothetical protein